MKIRVRYSAQLAHVLGTVGETVDLEADADLGDLMASVAGSHGERFREMVLDGDGRIRAGMLVAIDGEEVQPGREPALRDGNEILLLMPIAGG